MPPEHNHLNKPIRQNGFVLILQQQQSICTMSVSGCKSLTNSRTHKQTEWNQNIKLLLRVCANRAWDLLRDQHTETETKTERQGDSEGERLAKYKHHACSIMAKSSHTGNSSQDHSHLSPLSFTQLNGKVQTTAKQTGCQKKKGVKGQSHR